MAMNRANIARELVPGLNAVFGMAYGEVDNEHTVLFDTERSERAFEEEVLFTGFGTAPVKNEGGAFQYDDAQESFTSRYIHETVALGYAITEEAIEDNLYDTWAPLRTKALGRAMANTKQVKAANVFNNGFSTSYPIGDRVAFFSASHPTVGAGNQSNTLAADISEAALETAWINVSLTKDDRGILIGAMCKSLHIPPQLRFVVQRILKSELRPFTANNELNALKSLGYFQDGAHVNHRFTDSGAWFIRTDVPNGTKMFVRRPLRMEEMGDFDTGNKRIKATERYSFGVSDWRQWYGAT